MNRRILLSTLGSLILTTSVLAQGPLFNEVASAVGLDFEHRNGMSGEHYFSEMMGAGGAFFDYDGDGDLDVYLLQGHPLKKGGESAEHRDRLYRNELLSASTPKGAAKSRSSLHFVDVTEESGILATGYGMGVATGDVDNDGHVDLYISNFGHNQLWRNRGDGTFEDITKEAGVDDQRWSVSATFFDFDRDGWLDLFVTHYVAFALANHKPCRSHTGAPDYCSPLAYSPEPNLLLRNRGADTKGRITFERVTAKGGLREASSSLGVVASDLNGDGWPDLYVANDQAANQLWLNQRNGTFVNEALLAGIALNGDGRPEASMGIAAGDVDGDGDEDLLVSHLVRETNTLYLNGGDGFFEDGTTKSGLGTLSWEATGFGIAFLDIDNDGRLDLAAANGSVKYLEALVRSGDPFPLHQPNQVFLNRGGGRFEEVTAAGGAALAHSEVSRGLAVGDIDNDGDADLLITNNHGPVRLLLNQEGQNQGWLGLRLLTGQGRDALGARVGLVRAGKPTLWRWVRSNSSYLSASDPRVLFGLGDSPPGLGDSTEARKVEIHWPDGQREERQISGLNRYHVLHQREAK